MKNNTLDKKEIEKFSKIAEEWWNPNGKFKPLHKFNPIRISYIKENIIKMPKGARAEGGYVMPWNEYIFVGYSEKIDFEKYIVARTNKAGLEFLETSFPSKKKAEES